MARTAAAIVFSTEKRSELGSLSRHREHTRDGVTPLFASLGIATGRIIGRCCRRCRCNDIRRFLDEIEAAINDCICATSAGPKPISWTKSIADILASIQWFCLATPKAVNNRAENS